MTLRQQRRNQKKVNKPTPVKQVQKKVPNISKKKTNYSATNKQKNKQLTNLSAILKGIIVYKTEIAELHRLLDKYPNEIPVAYALA